LIRLGRALGVPDPNPWREPHPAFCRCRLAQHRTTWEPPAGPRSSRCLDPRGWTLLFAGVRFGRSVPRAPSVLGPKRIPARNRACSSARRRLATSWMLTLRAPSFHVGAGRAFTRPVPTSDAFCRRPAPACRLLLPDRQLLPRVLLSSARGQFHRTTRIVPPSPRLEEPSPLSREDGGTTQGVFCRLESSACLRRSTRPFSHAHPTPLGAGQSHSSCLPCYVRA